MPPTASQNHRLAGLGDEVSKVAGAERAVAVGGNVAVQAAGLLAHAGEEAGGLAAGGVGAVVDAGGQRVGAGGGDGAVAQEDGVALAGSAVAVDLEPLAVPDEAAAAVLGAGGVAAVDDVGAAADRAGGAGAKGRLASHAAVGEAGAAAVSSLTAVVFEKESVSVWIFMDLC